MLPSLLGLQVTEILLYIHTKQVISLEFDNSPTSPPNRAILSLTHCNAAIWSSNPKLLAVLPVVPGLKNPVIKKGN